MSASKIKPGLRPFLPADTAICAAIYEDSISELTGEEYTEAQQEAWIAALDEADLGGRLGRQLTLIATLNDAPVGFASLKGTDHIDMIYVHPSATRQGVGNSLCDALERLAGARGAAKLTADVSDTAHQFFTKRGYVDYRRNTIPLGDEWLGNTTMHKALMSEAPKGPLQ